MKFLIFCIALIVSVCRGMCSRARRQRRGRQRVPEEAVLKDKRAGKAAAGWDERKRREGLKGKGGYGGDVWMTKQAQVAASSKDAGSHGSKQAFPPEHSARTSRPR